MSVIAAARKCTCCVGGCEACQCLNEGSSGYYCGGIGEVSDCTPDYPSSNGYCCELLCNGATGALQVTQGQNVWSFPKACRRVAGGVTWQGWLEKIQFTPYLTVDAVKNVNDMYYYAKVVQEYQQGLPNNFHIECYQMYAWSSSSWTGMTYRCTMEKRQNATIIETNEGCELSGGTLLYSSYDEQEHRLAVGTQVPDITLFNDSSIMEPFFPRAFAINWLFNPKFGINTLKKGEPC